MMFPAGKSSLFLWRDGEDVGIEECDLALIRNILLYREEER
jgi:hypothetical protein